MTPRESEIIELIKNNPKITQKEIANLLNIKRSSVATHIKNLSNQGYILGRVYLLREEDFVLVIGGANIDIVGYSNENLVQRDSNVGSIVKSSGGVGRNICENLSRLNVKTSLISVVGDDDGGEFLISELSNLGVDCENIFLIHNKSTSVYLAILDENKDMYIAINDMGIVDDLSPQLISKKQRLIEEAALCVIETNLSKDTIDYLLNNVNQKFFVDCVSVNKCKKLLDSLDKIYFLKANEYEAEFLSGIEIESVEDAKVAAKKIIDLGVKSLVISLGSRGCVYADKDKVLYEPSEKMKVENASGAGDAFMAAYVYAYTKGLDRRDRIKFATAGSRVTLKSKKANSDNFNLESIKEELKYVK